MNLNAMKNLNLDRVLEMDEAIAMSAEIRQFEAECEALELPTPDWVLKSADVLREEIARRTRADALAQMKRLETELESYKTVGEKKNEAQRQLAALQRKLGIGNRQAVAK
jgi:hypothetical protein